ncbi:MAG: bifunctional phosphoglucose/phosphomannose isomerase [candidate division WOR-3 bacterium]
MIELIRQFPDQIEGSFSLDIPHIEPKRGKIYICGMGGSAASGDILKAIVPDVPIEVVRDYYLPSFLGEEDAVIAVSYSGNTEETLSAYAQAIEKRVAALVVASGGKLLEAARADGVPYVVIPGGLPPRCALGWLMSPMILALSRAGMIPSQLEDELRAAPDLLRGHLPGLEGPSSPTLELANKFYNRLPFIYASRRFYPVAFRWCAQINENAKSIAHAAALPEMNHNEVSGIVHPKDFVEGIWVVFLRFPEDYERTSARADITSELIRDSVMGITHLRPEGSCTLHRVLWCLLFGDMLSYYLALAYKADPFAIPRIDVLKERLGKL